MTNDWIQSSLCKVFCYRLKTGVEKPIIWMLVWQLYRHWEWFKKSLWFPAWKSNLLRCGPWIVLGPATFVLPPCQTYTQKESASTRIKYTKSVLCPFSLLLFPVLYQAIYILHFNTFCLELSSFLRKQYALTYVWKGCRVSGPPLFGL